MNASSELAVIDGGKSEQLDEQAAKKLNEDIHKACNKIATDSFELVTLLEQAATGQIHAALGYPSWTAWLAHNVKIDISIRDERKMMAALMSRSCMSQRAIAKALGVSQKTIDRDLERVSHDDSPATTGLDGRTYPREVESKPRRRPIPDQWRDAVYKLTKDAERLARITEDDRFAKYREDFAQGSAARIGDI